MALAMMGGLIAATVMTLTFLPALYALAFRVRVPRRVDAQFIGKGRQQLGEGSALQAAA
jgi:hypothetical protein